MKMPTELSLRISKESQAAIIRYVGGIMTAKRKQTELYAKMAAIDVAYARYKMAAIDEEGYIGGVDYGSHPCNPFAADDVIAPIVVSQVDTMVANLADVFLSGSPLFPIVSTPAKRKWAEQLETLLDDHATVGSYARQLLMFLRDSVKYNIGAVEADWTAIDQFTLVPDFTEAKGQSLNKASRSFTGLKRLDMYNTVYDTTVLPGDVAKEGDYAGYVDILSQVKLKRLLNKYTATREVYNASKAIEAMGGSAENYILHPTVSSYISPRKPLDEVDWEAYLGMGSKRRSIGANNYERITIYGRILPADFGIAGPQPNHPQIWKFVVIQGDILVHAKRIISAYDYLPILFGQPLEDGLGNQTQSYAEMEMPIQEAATTLYNIRFAAARRAVSDRALYDPALISPSDVNSPVSAPKIPVRINALSEGGLDRAYKSIPFDMRGTETTIQDASVLVDFSKQLTGLNNPQQGQFQKGNKSVQEFNAVMGGSENRIRLPALCLEYQVFVPLKSILLLNLYQYGSDATVVSQRTGEVLDVKLDELRKQVLSFRIADGYSPKSKMAGTEMLAKGLDLLMNSPALQQAYGTSLPAMFAHLMELGGVRGLEEYAPEIQKQAGGEAPLPALAAPAGVPPGQVPPGQAPMPENPAAPAPVAPTEPSGLPQPPQGVPQ